MTTISQSRKTFFVLLCLLLFFNGIGLLWKRRIIEKNNGLNSEFDIENNIQNAEDFSVWKMSVLDPNGGNVSFIKNNDFVTRFNHEVG